MSLKRPSLAMHKVPALENKKAKNPAQSRVPRTVPPQHLHGHVCPCPHMEYRDTARGVTAAMPGTDAAQVALPVPILTPRTCHATWQGPRGEENLRAGRTVSSEARRRSAGDLDISQGHTASKALGTPKSSRVRRPQPAKTRGSGSAVPGHQSSSADGVGRCWKRSRTAASSPQPGRRRPGGAAGSSATSVRAKWRGAGTEGREGDPPAASPPAAALPSPARRRRARAVRRGRRLPMRGSAQHRAFPGAARLSPARGGKAAQHGGVWSRARLSRRSRGPPALRPSRGGRARPSRRWHTPRAPLSFELGQVPFS